MCVTADADNEVTALASSVGASHVQMQRPAGLVLNLHAQSNLKRVLLQLTGIVEWRGNQKINYL